MRHPGRTTPLASHGNADTRKILPSLRDDPAYYVAHMAPTGPVPHEMVTTAFELDNFRIVRTLGMARGIIVRSRSIFGSIGAGLQTIVGGNISLFTKMCERTREDSFNLMLEHAGQMGGNAVIGARYDATEIMNGVTEVLAYGTAVVVEPIR